ncbi:6-hydroxymethylpterin diphosphokinase MptE-like protein [Campylobacter troglodytis]|uniref:6-hydroxymethylpterin diphosphokinase MptE-like protein n=1 Tax=Campylobacter troglodytis TaxID=654363 RepID=UPI00115A5C39|nr:6-hydroxymethylpterin diphosphokinase MptE-like protein [Campylobacter troglodytis]TQR60425.1 hypothetical protein DMC01_05915 [Campylobacter troglodytis]
MNFNDIQKKIYAKNLKVLEGSLLEKKFKAYKKPKCFIPHFSSDSLDINIEDLRTKSLIYEYPLQELSQKLSLYQDKYILYPYLYFYGLGNGLLYKVLLQNEQLRCIVVFESNLELIWLIFHLVDLSKELRRARLVILTSCEYGFFKNFFLDKNRRSFAKSYFLASHSLYYEKFTDELNIINETVKRAINDTALEFGNSLDDALQGLHQLCLNYVKFIKAPNNKEFFSKRVAQDQTAICVATGPSLTKQLPLLKEIQDRVAIFAADSAYVILMQNDIVPDYIFSLERLELTSEFFKEDYKDKDKDSVFVLADVVHPKSLNYLDLHKKQYVGFTRSGGGGGNCCLLCPASSCLS